MRYRKSFTLIEMIIVLVILALLATALIPRLQNSQKSAKNMKTITWVKTYISSFLMYNSDNGIFPCSWRDCIWGWYPNNVCLSVFSPNRRDYKGTWVDAALSPYLSSKPVLFVEYYDNLDGSWRWGGANYKYNTGDHQKFIRFFLEKLPNQDGCKSLWITEQSYNTCSCATFWSNSIGCWYKFIDYKP